MDKVLRNFPAHKARGTDHWQPKELLVLPRILKEELIKWMQKCEETGEWPEDFSHTLVTLIAKPGAQHEGQLRPIGLLPYVYRVWMKMRKSCVKNWIRHLYGAKVQGPLEATWLLSAQEERCKYKNKGLLGGDCPGL